MGVTGPIIHPDAVWISYNFSKPVRRNATMSGCNMSFLKDKLIEVGGFDEFFGNYDGSCEEYVPQLILLKRGYSFIIMPKAIVRHCKYARGGSRLSLGYSSSSYDKWLRSVSKYLRLKYFSKNKIICEIRWVKWNLDIPYNLYFLLPILRHKPRMLLDFLVRYLFIDTSGSIIDRYSN